MSKLMSAEVARLTHKLENVERELEQFQAFLDTGSVSLAKYPLGHQQSDETVDKEEIRRWIDQIYWTIKY